MRIVIALGGNAMTSADGRATPTDQIAAIKKAASPVAELVAQGHELLLTHGNGPQVGNLLVKNELTSGHVPPVPLDWCGAQTQGTIGMLVVNALDNAFARRGLGAPTAALVSRTLVDPADPGFTTPTKPIGRYLTAAETEPLIAQGQKFVEVEGRGWRRVVASPQPIDCIDAPSAGLLMSAGYLVVCSGGGGIPTIRTETGELRGIEAVIDKDLTASLLARQLQADLLIIATDVEAVVTGFGTGTPRPVGRVRVEEMRRIAAEQNFAAGSMGPKVEAITRFAAAGSGIGVITSLEKIAQAVNADAGTRVMPQPEAVVR